MNNFTGRGFKKTGKDFGGRPKFGGNTFGGDKRSGGKFNSGHDRGGRPGAQPELFTATCAECRKSCEVPFRPHGDKPVYCSACFGMQKSDGTHDTFAGERGASRGRDSLRSGKPEYTKSPRDERSPQRAPERVSRDGELEEVKQHLAMIDTRLTRMFDLLKQVVTEVKSSDTAAVTVEAPPKKERKPKAEKKKVTPTKKVVKKAAKKVVKK